MLQWLDSGGRFVMRAGFLASPVQFLEVDGTLAGRATGYGFAGVLVDGNDLFASTASRGKCLREHAGARCRRSSRA
jgi:TPP-dependent pyruvate/acetoin dehydrogenase alpha subunit